MKLSKALRMSSLWCLRVFIRSTMMTLKICVTALKSYSSMMQVLSSNLRHLSRSVLDSDVNFSGCCILRSSRNASAGNLTRRWSPQFPTYPTGLPPSDLVCRKFIHQMIFRTLPCLSSLKNLISTHRLSPSLNISGPSWTCVSTKEECSRTSIIWQPHE